jgi:hypothetical protein
MGESLRPAAGVTSPDASTVYPLGSSQGESARLQRQAEELAADSAALLDRVGLLPGQSAIDSRVVLPERIISLVMAPDRVQ